MTAFEDENGPLAADTQEA